MKEERKVFVRGVKGRGREVIKMLGCRGGKNNLLLHGDDPQYLYFINHEDTVSLTLFDSEFGKIIMDNYTELHLSEQYQDGDILVDNDKPDRFLIKSNTWVGGWGNRFKAYLFVNPAHIQESPAPIFCNADYHKANSEEVRQFHEILHKHGKDWDAEKKELVNWRWKPNDDEGYYCIHSTGTVHSCTWLDDGIDNSRFSIGNCFKTKEEAETMAEKIKKLLKGE